MTFSTASLYLMCSMTSSSSTSYLMCSMTTLSRTLYLMCSMTTSSSTSSFPSLMSSMSCKSKKPRKVRQKKKKKNWGWQLSSWQMFFFGGGKCPNLGVVNVRILGVVNVLLANDSQSPGFSCLITFFEIRYLIILHNQTLEVCGHALSPFVAAV